MRHISLLLLFSLGLAWGCGPGNKNQVASSEIIHTTDSSGPTNDPGLDIAQVPTHTVPQNPELKSLHNIRYSFKITIPVEWTALDKSGNGDGFAISIPGNPVEILVYGETYDSALSAFYESDCSEAGDYAFDNGTMGRHCIQGGANSFWMVNDRIKINLYIKDLNSLSPAEADLFAAMAKSLSFFETGARSS